MLKFPKTPTRSRIVLEFGVKIILDGDIVSVYLPSRWTDVKSHGLTRPSYCHRLRTCPSVSAFGVRSWKSSNVRKGWSSDGRPKINYLEFLLASEGTLSPWIKTQLYVRRNLQLISWKHMRKEIFKKFSSKKIMFLRWNKILESALDVKWQGS
jgi:hypothetical protein